MRSDLFEKFYNDSISVIASELISRHPGYKYVSNQKGVYEEYLNQKTMLRTLIKNGADDHTQQNLLDGHKIAACITCALIKLRLIFLNDVTDDPDAQKPYMLDSASRMNEQFSLLCGLSCLLAFMKDDPTNLYPDGQESEKIDLILPKTYYEGRSDYLSSLTRALYYSNILSCINPLLLSNIFFLLDKYHRRSVELLIAQHNYQQREIDSGGQ